MSEKGGGSGGSQQRGAERFDVQLNVLLPDGTGVTRNASSTGVFFITDLPMAVGAPIAFTLVFEMDDHETVHLNCDGEIVRIEDTDGRTGVAAKINSTTFRHPDGTAPDI